MKIFHSREITFLAITCSKLIQLKHNLCLRILQQRTVYHVHPNDEHRENTAHNPLIPKAPLRIYNKALAPELFH
jgi:hypothetical protein